MSNFPKPQPGQTGYIYVGSAYGTFTGENGRPVNYCNLFVLRPMQPDANRGSYGDGWRAEKLRCESQNVIKGFEVGDEVQLYFDQYGRVTECVLRESISE